MSDFWIISVFKKENESIKRKEKKRKEKKRKEKKRNKKPQIHTRNSFPKVPQTL